MTSPKQYFLISQTIFTAIKTILYGVTGLTLAIFLKWQSYYFDVIATFDRAPLGVEWLCCLMEKVGTFFENNK